MFDVPNELRDHLEITPKTVFIQAKSEFYVQLKLNAKDTIHQDAPSYFDSDTSVLQVPLSAKVADQVSTTDSY
jgi:hypothetical protein